MSARVIGNVIIQGTIWTRIFLFKTSGSSDKILKTPCFNEDVIL